MPGVSFDRDLLPMLDGPTYLVNCPDKVRLDNVVFFTADSLWLQYYWENGMFPICFLDWYWPDFDGTMCAASEMLGMAHIFDDPRVTRISGYHKAVGLKDSPIGTGLGCVAVMGHLANQVEIYGWDFYLGCAPNHLPYWKAFYGMINVSMHLVLRRTIQSGIYNWHYAYRFSQLASFNIHGYLGQLDRHTRLLRKLDRIFYQQ